MIKSGFKKLNTNLSLALQLLTGMMDKAQDLGAKDLLKNGEELEELLIVTQQLLKGYFNITDSDRVIAKLLPVDAIEELKKVTEQFIEQREREFEKLNFRLTDPRDLHTPIDHLKLPKFVMEELKPYKVLYIGELDVFAKSREHLNFDHISISEIGNMMKEHYSSLPPYYLPHTMSKGDDPMAQNPISVVLTPVDSRLELTQEDISSFRHDLFAEEFIKTTFDSRTNIETSETISNPNENHLVTSWGVSYLRLTDDAYKVIDLTLEKRSKYL